MLTRNDVLSRAVDDCLKELYSLAQPNIEWDKFVKENETYSKKYETWERFNRFRNKKEDLTEKELEEYSKFPSNWENKSITECIGPRPYEFYYLPREIFKEVVDSYIYAYKMDDNQNLLDIIKILKDYCNKPIVDKYIDDYTDEHGNHHPGYRSYDHPDNLKKEIESLIKRENEEINESELASNCIDKFFEFLDMAGNFFEWNRDLNTFSCSIYLGVSPNSDKQAVIDNWKKYRDQDIEIDESKYKEDNDYD